MRPRLLYATLSVAVVACSDPTDLPRSEGGSPTLANQQNAGNGAVVIRYTAEGFQFGVTDFDQNLTALWGLSLEQHLAQCAAPGSVTFDPIEFLEVHRKDGSFKVSIKGGETPVVIWGSADFDVCGSLLDAPVIATGTIDHFIYTDRDLSAIGLAANSFGVRGHGEVVLTETGQVSRLNAFFHISISASGIFHVTDRLTFTP